MDNALQSLCRDCGTLAQFEGRCPECGSQRLRRHSELGALSIAHIDCDAFFAAVEKRDNPALADLPVLVGGGTRGVVATCCYIARTYGVRSAMPMFKAKALCPEAVIIKPRFDAYQAAAREIRAVFDRATPLVQPISIDEAFLDLSGTSRLHGAAPASVLAHLARQIEQDIGITVSVGLSYNKFLAKLASDLDKPRGFAVIGRTDAMSILAPMPPTAIFGVGPAMGARLVRDGYPSLAHIQREEPAVLAKKYGENGLRLSQLARGQDNRPVTPSRAAKSISSETTFPEDLKDRTALEDHIYRLAQTVSARAKKKKLRGRVVTVKLKTAGFRGFTRRTTLADASNLAKVIEETAIQLLHHEEPNQCTRNKYRLIGVGLSDLCADTDHPEQFLFDEGDERLHQREAAVDRLKEKFGADIIGTVRDQIIRNPSRKDPPDARNRTKTKG
ncbi:MAG: DNA polymerase IV [Parvularcula sp.]